jgi:hypothetical protein
MSNERSPREVCSTTIGTIGIGFLPPVADDNRLVVALAPR